MRSSTYVFVPVRVFVRVYEYLVPNFPPPPPPLVVGDLGATREVLWSGWATFRASGARKQRSSNRLGQEKQESWIAG